MLQRKKLEYYAKQVGIEDLAGIQLTDEDCKKICSAVGIRYIPAADVGKNICTLIACVMDEPEFIKAHHRDDVSEDLQLIRCGDYAAQEVFKAYVKQ